MEPTRPVRGPSRSKDAELKETEASSSLGQILEEDESLLASSPREDRLAGLLLKGTYQLIEYIASGGYAEVWRAEHVGLQKHVVVKILHDQFSSDQGHVRSLVREARITAELASKSDHIVGVSDVGEQDGLAYYVMEDLDGSDLRKHLASKRPLAIRRARSLLRQLLEGLAIAHAAGVIHRDLKPNNIFVESREGIERIRILDFGIAKARTHITTTHQVPGSKETRGTLRYMPPEWLTGPAPAATPTLDVFAVGIVAYEMLTGKHPLADLSAIQIGARYQAKIPLPNVSEASSEPVPSDLANVVNKALELSPDKRFADAREMLVALKRTEVIRPRSLPAGLLIQNRYEVRRKLGQGGMGAVYEVADKQKKRRAALKIVAPPDGRPREYLSHLHARFDQECEALWHRVSHPAIVPIVDKGHVGGNPYCVMAYVEGTTLSPALWKQRGWSAVVHVLEGVADALDSMHQTGVVHRDVKPSNILVQEDGRPVLIDFGIAKLPDSELTQTGVEIGTPGFAAPEQLVAAPRGKANVSGHTDQWALAAIIYTFLSGCRPGESKGPKTKKPDALLRRVLNDQITPLEQLHPELPRKLTNAVMRGLSHMAHDRFDSCAALIHAVARASKNLEIAPPASPHNAENASADPTSPQRRGWPTAIGIGAAVVAAAVLALVFWPARADHTPAEGELPTGVAPSAIPNDAHAPSKASSIDASTAAPAGKHPIEPTSPASEQDAANPKSKVRTLRRGSRNARRRGARRSPASGKAGTRKPSEATPARTPKRRLIDVVE